MKLGALFLLFVLVFNAFASQVEDNEKLRVLFHKVKSEDDLDEILEYKSKMNDAISEAYFGSVIMMKAQYPFSPIKKLQYFAEGKKLVEKSISDKQSVENTYLRLLIQLNTPRFLGYYGDIQKDLTFIEKNIEGSSLTKKWKIKFLEQILSFENDDFDYQKLKDKLAKIKTS